MLEIPRAPVSPGRDQFGHWGHGPGRRTPEGCVTGALAEHPGLRVTEFASYPPKRDDLPQKLAQTYDVLMVDVDCDAGIRSRNRRAPLLRRPQLRDGVLAKPT